MNNFILGIAFLALAIIGVIIKKTYYFVPSKELKRRAERHDTDAIKLYKAVAYGKSLKTLLWLFIGFTASASFIVLAKVLPTWLSLLIIAPLLYIVFSLIPASRISRFGLILTKGATPIISWILNYTHPLINRAHIVIDKHYKPVSHTGLFERNDLLELIDKQQNQSDSQLSVEELEIIKRAITFDEKKVSDVLIPRKNVKTLIATDTIGPILINELHETSAEYVLVKESKKGPVVGTLAFKDLSIKSHGLVQENMDKTLYYLHEDDLLGEALHAFFVTNHPLFVVVNSFEEYSGIVTIEAILRELLGHIPGDDFEEYTSLVAVSGRHQKTKKDTAVSSNEEETPVNTDTEVIE